MSRLNTLLSMSAQDRHLLARAFVLNAWARLALEVMAIDRLRAWASCRGGGKADLARIVWASRAAARRTPFATCQSSALALQRLMAANGLESDLHIGVAHDAGALVAHAWIERDGVVLIGEDEQRQYARLMNWRAGAPDG